MEENIIKLIERVKENERCLDGIGDNDDYHSDLWESVLDFIGIPDEQMTNSYNTRGVCYECILTDDLTPEQLYHDLMRIKKMFYS